MLFFARKNCLQKSQQILQKEKKYFNDFERDWSWYKLLTF
jgi:hypothetical protein